MREYLVRVEGSFYEDIYVTAESATSAIENAIDITKEKTNDGEITINYEGVVLRNHII